MNNSDNEFDKGIIRNTTHNTMNTNNTKSIQSIQILIITPIIYQQIDSINPIRNPIKVLIKMHEIIQR